MKFKKGKVQLTDQDNKRFHVDGYVATIDLYHLDLDVVFGQKKQMNRFMPGCDGFVHETNVNYYILWVNKKSSHSLIHEIYHLVNYISKTRGLSEDKCNEQQAYLMGWLYKEIKKLK